MKKDLIIGLVGTLILVTAMIGVFRFEAGQVGTAYRVTWATETAEVASLQGGTNEGQPTLETVTVGAQNLTQLSFVLEWVDNLGDPDTFNLTIISPTGESRSVEGSNGRLEVTFPNLGVAPSEIQVNGASEESVHARLVQDYSSTRGSGEYNVTITLVDAGDQGVPVAGVPVQEDGANDWTLTAMGTLYRAQVSRA